MANRDLGAFELEIVSLVGKRISQNESREVARTVRWLGDFLSRRGKHLLTAQHLDIQDFCEERSSTRIDASMVRMISSLKAVFRTLHDTGYRSDDPCSELRRARLPAVTPSYAIVDDVMPRLTLLTLPILGETARQAFSRKRLSAIIRLAYEAGATYPEMAALDVVCPTDDVILARGVRRERKARFSPDGRIDIDQFCEERCRFVQTSHKALFTSSLPPWRRLDAQAIVHIVQQAISKTGLSSTELSPIKIYKSVPGSLVAHGLGWDAAAASVAYSKIPNVQRKKTDLETMKRFIETFDRFRRPT